MATRVHGGVARAATAKRETAALERPRPARVFERDSSKEIAILVNRWAVGARQVVRRGVVLLPSSVRRLSTSLSLSFWDNQFTRFSPRRRMTANDRI